MSTSRLFYAVWAALAAASLTLWLIAVRWPAVVERPSKALGTLIRGRVLRAAAVVGWMFLGWHLFAR